MYLRSIGHVALCAATISLLCSCSSAAAGGVGLAEPSDAFTAEARAAAGSGAEESPRSYTIKSAMIELEVDELDTASAEIEKIVRERSGSIESKEESSAELVLMAVRIPAARLDESAAAVASLGEVTSSRFSEQDVTDQYIDTEAKLTNLRALRDRLRGILDRAKDVKDVLAVEEQLTRVQTELDQLEARLKHLTGKIRMSTLQIVLRKEHTPGPVGLVIQASTWLIGKLFVLD